MPESPSGNLSSSVFHCGPEDELQPARMEADNGCDAETDARGHVELNPMLMEVVLEKLFPYCKSSLPFLKSLRLVCKTWDAEVGKILRRKTEIDVTNLVAPAPYGLGWTDRCTNGSSYRAVYRVPAFENIKVHGTCKTLKKSKVIRWFQSMGASVKQLHYQSTLVCYHQSRFLECVLKRWCKNLTHLYIDGAESLADLIYFSRFSDSSPGFVCNLKQITLSTEEDNLPILDCSDDSELSLYLKDCLSEHIEPEGRKMDVESQEGIGNPEFKSETGQIELALRTNGGLLGQIINASEIEKIVVRKFPTDHIDGLIVCLDGQPNALCKLTHLEYRESPILMWGWHMDKLETFKLPLKKLCVGSLTTRLTGTDVNRLLSSFKETLEHVELTGTVLTSGWLDNDEDEFINVEIPLLPLVKTFRNGNVFCTRVNGLDFVNNLPSLQKCSLVNAIYHPTIYPLNPQQVFNLLFQSASFDRPHPLQELHLDGKIEYTRHIELLKRWFPKLKKVDLTLDGSDVLVEFFRKMKHSRLVDVKVSFFSNDHEWCNIAFADCVGKMKKLKFLELVHKSDSPIAVSLAAFQEGFAVAPRLTSLKFENFSIFVHEAERILKTVQHLSCLKFTKCVPQYKPLDAEYSLGFSKPFPTVEM